METGRLYLDGTAIYGALDGVVRARLKMAMNGLVIVTLIIDEEGQPLGEAWAETLGLPAQGRGGQKLAEALEDAMAQELERADRRLLAHDERLTEALRRRVRNTCLDEIGKKPEVSVVISRLAEE